MALALTATASLGADAPSGLASETGSEIRIEVSDRLGRPVRDIQACVLASDSSCAPVTARSLGSVWVLPASLRNGVVRFQAPGFLPADVTVVDPPPPLALSSKGEVTLSVMSPDERREQVVTVNLWVKGGPPGSEKGLAEKRLLVPPRPATATVTFRDLPPAAYRVAWQGPLVSRGEKPFVLETHSARNLGSVTLLPGVMVEGAVLDELGAAVAGARVRLESRDPGKPLVRSVDTGPDGTFEVVGLPVGMPLEWTASAVGYETAGGRWAGETRLDAVLSTAQRVFGRLVDEEDDPVEDAGLSVSSKGKQAGGRRQLSRPDSRGEFSFYRSRPRDDEEQSLEVDPQRFVSVSIPLPPADGAAELDLGTIRLDRGRSLSGRVTEQASGKPIDGARVVGRTAPRPGTDAAARGSKTTVTKSDGSFELVGFPQEADLVVTATKEGWAPATGEVQSVASDRLDLALTRGGRIAGQVCAPASEASRVRVHVSRNQRGLPPLPEVIPSPDGRFALEALEPGEYSLSTTWVLALDGRETRAPGSESREALVREGETTAVSLDCDGTLVTGVVLLNGSPLPNAHGFFSIGAPEVLNLHTNERGEFSLRVRVPGPYATTIALGGPTAPEGVEIRGTVCQVPQAGTVHCTVSLSFSPPWSSHAKADVVSDLDGFGGKVRLSAAFVASR